MKRLWKLVLKHSIDIKVNIIIIVFIVVVDIIVVIVIVVIIYKKNQYFPEPYEHFGGNYHSYYI